ncbi:MAG: phosphoribosylformylglycinamidine cyclo-ligase [Candidatus Omnitrophota bacterium]
MGITYKESGVDIKRADKFLRMIRPSQAGAPKAFGSLFNLNPHIKGCRNPVLVSSTDGVGTKLKIAQQLNIHHTVGVDLVAMNVNDIICLGARPLFFLDYIACGKIHVNILNDVVKGIRHGLEKSDCLLLGGETAEMPGMYKTNEYDLAGFCVGIAEKSKLINGSSIKQGDIVIGLASSGLHSNGFSLVRRALRPSEIRDHARQLLEPTRIYVKPVLSLLRNARQSGRILVKGIAHITGGSFYDKAVKILPKGFGMVIYKKTWEAPEIFGIIQKKGNIEERQMYTVFNMGIGMMVVVEASFASKAVRILSKHCGSSIIGEIAKQKDKMTIS